MNTPPKNMVLVEAHAVGRALGISPGEAAHLISCGNLGDEFGGQISKDALDHRVAVNLQQQAKEPRK